MFLHQLSRKQILPISLEIAWQFFSSPHNLTQITPPDLGFKVKPVQENQNMYAGMIIGYTVKPFLNISVDWLTEITHIKEPFYFVDEQRFGPYTFWHHQHWFKEVKEGIEMTDLVTYKIPYGFVGELAHLIFIKKRLEYIFDYRFNKLEKLFPK